VRKIRAYYHFTARGPELINRLIEHISKLENYLQAFENSSMSVVKAELARSEATLELLQKMVDRPTQQLIEHVLQEVVSYRRTANPTKSQLSRVYANMSKVTDKVTDYQEDKKWER
jgi:hypothetical protein